MSNRRTIDQWVHVENKSYLAHVKVETLQATVSNYNKTLFVSVSLLLKCKMTDRKDKHDS